MWDLPRPGVEPVSPALAGGFLTTAPPGKPLVGALNPPAARGRYGPTCPVVHLLLQMRPGEGALGAAGSSAFVWGESTEGRDRFLPLPRCGQLCWSAVTGGSQGLRCARTPARCPHSDWVRPGRSPHPPGPGQPGGEQEQGWGHSTPPPPHPHPHPRPASRGEARRWASSSTSASWLRCDASLSLSFLLCKMGRVSFLRVFFSWQKTLPGYLRCVGWHLVVSGWGTPLCLGPAPSITLGLPGKTPLGTVDKQDTESPWSVSSRASGTAELGSTRWKSADGYRVELRG